MSEHTFELEVMRFVTVTGRVELGGVEVLSATIDGHPITLTVQEMDDACSCLCQEARMDKRQAEMDAAEWRLP